MAPLTRAKGRKAIPGGTILRRLTLIDELSQPERSFLYPFQGKFELSRPVNRGSPPGYLLQPRMGLMEDSPGRSPGLLYLRFSVSPKGDTDNSGTIPENGVIYAREKTAPHYNSRDR